MRILLVHTHYQQRGGEDESFAAEAQLLESHGQEVVRFTRHNDELAGMNRWTAAAKTVWNRTAYRDVRELIQRTRPEVMHCTNTFPLLSPAVYYAAQAERVPVVQSLRNYRQLCPSALFLRDSQVCEDCLGKRFAWPGVLHGCYRGSRLATAVVAGMTSLHGALGTWSRAVGLYFTLTEFAKQRFVAAGWPAEKIRVKPNFLATDPGIGGGQGNYAVFVGRLSEEKGIATLLEAWRQLPDSMPLKIIGEGPLQGDVARFAAQNQQVQYLGQRSLPEVLEILGSAKFLVMPSIWYETFGRTIMEAFAKGTPVIASNLGAMAELVDSGVTGLTFPAGDATALAKCVQQMCNDSARVAPMRMAARAEFERRFTAAQNHDQLLAIYEEAIANSRHVTHAPAIEKQSVAVAVASAESASTCQLSP